MLTVQKPPYLGHIKDSVGRHIAVFLAALVLIGAAHYAAGFIKISGLM